MTVPLVKFLTLHCIVCVLLPTSADNVTLLTFAAERRADGPIAANPPPRHGTDTRTDTVPLHRPCLSGRGQGHASNFYIVDF